MMSVLRVLGVILIWTQAETQSQPEFSRTTTLGATLHVNCQVYSGSRTVVWYKQDSSRRLQLMVSANSHKGQNLYKDSRYSVQSSEDRSTLRVSRVTWEDAGTYYCGVMNEYDVNFGPGTVVVVEGKSRPPPSVLQTVLPSVQSVVQSPDYIRVQPGDSVTLSCWFNTSLCTKDHISVQWKKKSSTSGTMSWSNGTKNIICENQVNTGETSCVHTQTWSDLSSAEGEMFVCVVTACGHTLQGRGTKIQPHDTDSCIEGSSVVFCLRPTVLAVIGLSTGLAVPLLGLVCVLCRNHQKQEPDTGRGVHQDNQAEDGIIYARVNVSPSRGSRETS
ncbi:T cell receptor alpha chain MC.7.G5-like [Boleophthalmus pectinirostris]|uniref:T cell receptor alpha chain MC.7.G5-like n=1 Tax=Boleophthalmus pectinirostris TaxID=150288 RepID=UPI0024316EC0|nr:T cell receptor alpha chain MC.7.G5-like [Boleophthalmus pectinirostris]